MALAFGLEEGEVLALLGLAEEAVLELRALGGGPLADHLPPKQHGEWHGGAPGPGRAAAAAAAAHGPRRRLGPRGHPPPLPPPPRRSAIGARAVPNSSRPSRIGAVPFLGEEGEERRGGRGGGVRRRQEEGGRRREDVTWGQ